MDTHLKPKIASPWLLFVVSGALAGALLLCLSLATALGAPARSTTGPVAFGGTLFVCDAFHYAYGLALGDLDGDGDLDTVVSADGGAVNDYELFACENTGSGWITHSIGAVNTHANTVALGDLDYDGDLDVALASGSGTTDGMEVSIWENDGVPFDGPWTPYGVGYSPSNLYDIAAGDLDNDGDLDLITGAEAHASGSEIVIWGNPFNAGAANPFSTGWASKTINNGNVDVRSVALGDLDRDGDLDAAAIGDGANGYVATWRNPLAPGSDPFLLDWWGVPVVWNNYYQTVTMADLDRDGDLDMLASGAGQMVALSNSGAPFSIPWSVYPLDMSSCADIAVGDLDHDGDLDVVTGGWDPTWVTIWVGDGTPFDGGWTQRNLTNWGTGADIKRVALGDADNDGDLDVFASGHVADASPNVRLWRNLAAPHATPYRAVSSTVGLSTADARDLAFADLDNDGDGDLLAAQATGGLSTWENDGTPFAGLWASSTMTVAEASYVVVADLDWDGDLDAVSADPGVWVWENPLASPKADTPFTTTWRGMSLFATGDYDSLAVADLDNDGRPDIVAGVASDSAPTLHAVYIWRNADATPFSGVWPSNTITSTALALRGVHAVAVADLDRDGWLDLLSTDDRGAGQGGVYAWRNDHTPFGDWWSETQVITGLRALDLLTGDFDVDGWPDVVMQGDTFVGGSIRALFNDGAPFTGTWMMQTVSTMGMGGANLVASDFDHDGDLDIASVPARTWVGFDLKIWPNPRSRAIVWEPYAQILASPEFPHTITTGDLDGNGDTDLVLGYSSSMPAQIVAWHLIGARVYLPLVLRSAGTP